MSDLVPVLIEELAKLGMNVIQYDTDPGNLKADIIVRHGSNLQIYWHSVGGVGESGYHYPTLHLQQIQKLRKYEESNLDHDVLRELLKSFAHEYHVQLLGFEFGKRPEEESDQDHGKSSYGRWDNAR